VEVSATATFDLEGGPRISRMALVVRGRVPGIEDAAFQEAANGAKDGCPVSGALKGNVEITLDATLES
jgi:osmotically inducible protein OsmC